MGLSQMLGRTWTKVVSRGLPRLLPKAFSYLFGGRTGGGGRAWLLEHIQLGVWTPDMSYWPGPVPH